ncbi:hypothetical protein PIB30_067264, partial [Stylosanthes scabra]|nr:hypothetical protein [Stylosanthes scabra]
MHSHNEGSTKKREKRAKTAGLASAELLASMIDGTGDVRKVLRSQASSSLSQPRALQTIRKVKRVRQRTLIRLEGVG